MASILTLHGPNLNLLGSREPQIYGTMTLDQLNKKLSQQAKQRGQSLATFQSNTEGTLIDRIQQAGREKTAFIIINPGALTHTSIGLRDVFLATKIPFIEVHLSNIHARESFRHHSYLSDIAIGVICGLGPQSYFLALEAACQQLQNHSPTA